MNFDRYTNYRNLKLAVYLLNNQGYLSNQNYPPHTEDVSFYSRDFSLLDREAMSEPRDSGVPGVTQNDVHDLEALAESTSEVSHLAALDHFTGVCEWTVSLVL